MTWIWGDGNQTVQSKANGTVSGPAVTYYWFNYSHVYHYNGDFNSELVVGGNNPSIYTPIYVSTVGEVSFQASPLYGTPPLQVSFSYETFYGRGYSAAWSFGDGNAPTQNTPNGTATRGNVTYQWWNYTHTYQSAGAFIAKVNVSLSKYYAAASTTENVAWAQRISFTGTPNFAGNPPMTVAFTFETEYGGGYSASWTFGDGNTSIQSAPNGTVSGRTVSYQWWNYTHTFQYIGAFNTSATISKSGHQATGWTFSYVSFVPSLFYSFYNESSLIARGVNGSTYSIGLVEECYPGVSNSIYQNDLHNFDIKFGLTDPTIRFVDIGGGSCPGTGWSPLETALDIEWAHVAAPGATIWVCLDTLGTLSGVESCNSWFYQNRTTDRTMLVSNSWGVCAVGWVINNLGCLNATDPYQNIDESAESAGMTILASTGDFEPLPVCYTAQYPASNPYVLAVGGTTVSSVSNSGSRGTEKVWYDSSKWIDCSYPYLSKRVYVVAWYGETYGPNSYYSAPSWQAGLLNNTKRYFPDVSMVGNNSTGVPVLSLGTWWVMGGTSVGSPIWAGILDVLFQAGAPGLSGFAAPFLYAHPSCFYVMTNPVGARDGLGTPNIGCLSTA